MPSAASAMDQVSARLVTRAPAKVNLTLEIIRRRPDGYHELESLVAFAGCADTLALTPGPLTSLVVEGPTAGAAGPTDDNLVLRAARNLAALVPGLGGGAFLLTKRLPAAAGIGGGSSDAAAALRLLARLNGLPADDPRIQTAAAETGADVPVCVDARARMMRGIGERLGPPLRLPPLFAVLVNPGRAVETRAVFARIGLKAGESGGRPSHPVIGDDMPPGALLPLLRKARNDMEDAASVLEPAIGSVIAALSAARGCRLARMSGSGATCWGLFDDCRTAAKAAATLRRDQPGWWVKATVLR